MKRLILSVIFLFTGSFSYAANKMSMVTYFPVPYVAYSQVSADQQLDVGLTSTCKMNLGCSQSNTNLKANTVNLKSGKLELNQGKGVLGDKILLGNGTGNGQIKFKNVRIQDGTVQSVNANTINVKELQLFGHKFPPCKGKGGSDGKMAWQELRLQGYGGTSDKGELYLVCGETASATCEPTDPRGATYAENCAGNNGQITYTWDYEECEYIPSGECGKKRCLTAAKFCQVESLVRDGSYEGGSDECTDKGCFKEYVQNFPFYQLPQYAEFPAGCKANGECPSCVIGKRYFTTNANMNPPEGWIRAVYGLSCRKNGVRSDKYLIQYSECVEVSGDCPVEANRDCGHDDQYMCLGKGTDIPSGPEIGGEIKY